MPHEIDDGVRHLTIIETEAKRSPGVNAHEVEWMELSSFQFDLEVAGCRGCEKEQGRRSVPFFLTLHDASKFESPITRTAADDRQRCWISCRERLDPIRHLD